MTVIFKNQSYPNDGIHLKTHVFHSSHKDMFWSLTKKGQRITGILKDFQNSPSNTSNGAKTSKNIKIEKVH